MDIRSQSQYELLAPAGQPEAGYAALHYGADAVYLGLGKFSARAEAVNFSPEELSDFVAYAHSLSPRRRVYLTLNTLLKNSEIADAADTLLTAVACGIDAVIIQDLGLAAFARREFPQLELHASTQMAIHNTAGALAAKRLGFHRVTLARELTLKEIGEICRDGGVEVETFIHGTLCYSYSGLCLFSSILTGRSGNRGRCVYSCREAADTPAGKLHPFSLKDMALGEDVLKLGRAGVTSFKIEGRKKSPLYVAATVDYYRRILDGTLAVGEKEEREARLQTIFARPWTKLFVHSSRNPDTADAEVVGHRGTPIGEILRLASTPAGPALVFTTARALERHDGIQIDIPGSPRPYGFAVDDLFVMGKGKPQSVFAAPAGDTVAVAIPADAPVLTPGLPLYQSSSQEVKRSYPVPRPRAAGAGLPLAAAFAVTVGAPDGDGGRVVTASASAVLPEALAGSGAGDAIRAELVRTLPCHPARDVAGAERAARNAFDRTGGSRFVMGGWEYHAPADAIFIKPGDWNRLRRDLTDALESAFVEHLANRRAAFAATLAHPAVASASAAASAAASAPGGAGRDEEWGLCVESPALLAEFGEEDLAAAAEIVVDSGAAESDLDALAARLGGREKIRLALPWIVRADNGAASILRARDLVARGWRKWLAGGLGARMELPSEVDLAADWSLYTLNRLAVEALTGFGFSSLAFSPEDDAANIRSLLESSGTNIWLTVYSDLPLFIAAACAHRHLGLCVGIDNASGRCRHAKTGFAACETTGETLDITMEKSGPVRIAPLSCGSLVTSATPFSLSGNLKETKGMGATRFRIDCRWRHRSSAECLALWREVRAGVYRGGTQANFVRGLM